jgi:hypothetical protein
MRLLNIILLALILPILFQYCAPKASKSKSVTAYSEDISALRPAFDDPEVVEDLPDPEAPLVYEKDPYVEPSHDITAELDDALVKIEEVQSQKPYIIYTVQVYNGRSRDQANEIRKQVYRILPEEKPQLEYRQPNYKVKIGSFQSRADAYKTFKKLKESFPGTILVPERITP